MAAGAVSSRSGKGECGCSQMNADRFSAYLVKSLVFSKGADCYELNVLTDVVAGRKMGGSCVRGGH